MTRLHCLMVAILSMFVATSIATPACSQGLMDVLESRVCHRQRRQHLTSAQTTIDQATSNDKCMDTLRVLHMTTPSVPCAASIVNKHRRLTVSESGVFYGALNCTFVKTDPLNVSDLSQTFIIDCKEITGPQSNLLWLYILLGVIYGLCALSLLWFIMREIIEKVTKWNDRRVKRANERTEAKQNEQDRSTNILLNTV